MYIELRTERLLLRPLDVMDLQTTHEYASDYDTTKYMVYLPNKSVEESLCFLTSVSEEWKKEEPSFYEFAITYDSKHIGVVSVRLNEDRTEGEFGWVINKKYWGQGFAKEAALAVKSFAVNQLRVKRLVATCDSRNISSAHVMEKIGLSFESEYERKYFDERGLAREVKYSCEIVDIPTTES